MAISKGRSRTALILFIVGTLLLPIGILGHWAHRTFTDTDRYVATVAPLAAKAEVQEGIAETVAGSLITVEGATAQVEQWFPNAPKGLVSTVAEAVVTRVQEITADLVVQLLASEQFANLWATANTDAQKAAIALLENEPPPSLSVQDGDVVLNLDVVKQTVRDRVAQEGIDLPQVQAGVLPPTVVLLQDSQIQQIRTYYSWGAPLMQWFILLPLLLLVLSVVLAPDKARATRRTGVGVLIAAAAVAAVLLLGNSALTPTFESTAFAPAQTVIWETLTAYLARAAWFTAGLGVVLVLAGWVWIARRPEVSEA